MDKIRYHIHKHKKKFISHIIKHHKKYIFASGSVIGLCIFKIIILITAFLGMSFITGRSSANDQEIEMYRTMNIFYKINEFADAEINEGSEEGNIFTEEKKKEYKTLDDAFHEAKNLNQRYKIAKKIVNFLLEQEKTRIHTVNDSDRDRERDEKLLHLLQVFNQIQ